MPADELTHLCRTVSPLPLPHDMIAIAISLRGAPWPGLSRVGGTDKDATVVGDAVKVEREDTLLVGIPAADCHAAAWGLCTTCWWRRRWRRVGCVSRASVLGAGYSFNPVEYI